MGDFDKSAPSLMQSGRRDWVWVIRPGQIKQYVWLLALELISRRLSAPHRDSLTGQIPL